VKTRAPTDAWFCGKRQQPKTSQAPAYELSRRLIETVRSSEKNVDLSKQYYRDIGFTMTSDVGGVAYFHFEHASFLLQDSCAKATVENFMMHMLVKDVGAWWNRINDSGVVAK
jgi:hypothetical protein